MEKRKFTNTPPTHSQPENWSIEAHKVQMQAKQFLLRVRPCGAEIWSQWNLIVISPALWGNVLRRPRRWPPICISRWQIKARWSHWAPFLSKQNTNRRIHGIYKKINAHDEIFHFHLHALIILSTLLTFPAVPLLPPSVSVTPLGKLPSSVGRYLIFHLKAKQ